MNELVSWRTYKKRQKKYSTNSVHFSLLKDGLSHYGDPSDAHGWITSDYPPHRVAKELFRILKNEKPIVANTTVVWINNGTYVSLYYKYGPKP